VVDSPAVPPVVEPEARHGVSERAARGLSVKVHMGATLFSVPRRSLQAPAALPTALKSTCQRIVRWPVELHPSKEARGVGVGGVRAFDPVRGKRDDISPASPVLSPSSHVVVSAHQNDDRRSGSRSQPIRYRMEEPCFCSWREATTEPLPHPAACRSRYTSSLPP